MYFKRTAEISTLLSIGFLFDKTVPLWGIKPDVIFLILATLSLLGAIITQQLIVPWKKLFPLFVLLAIIILSTVIGSLLSLHLFNTLPLGQIKTEYQILLGCFVAFLDIIILGYQNNTFLTYCMYAFLPSLIVIFFPYLPIPIIQHQVGVEQHRFIGLIGDADYYPTFAYLPTLLVFYFLEKDLFSNKKYLRAILLFLILSIAIGTMLWGGSRSGLLGLIVTFVCFSVLKARTVARTMRHFWILITIFIAAIIIGHALLPQPGKIDVNTRISYITTQQTFAGENSVSTNIAIIDSVSHSQDRLHIWQQGTHYIKKNPLGYGLVYYNIINIVSASPHATVHSIILELLLIGGILLLGTMVYIFFDINQAFWREKHVRRAVDTESLVYAALLGFVVCCLFLSAFLLRWMWIELAILIAWQLNRKATEVSS